MSEDLSRPRTEPVATRKESRVVALLDRPDPRSFGMVPFVTMTTLDGDDSFQVHNGLPGHCEQSLLKHDLEQLYQEGHALRTDATTTRVTPTSVAGWLGTSFEHASREVPHKVPLSICHPVVNSGRFFIADRCSVKQSLEQWVLNAAKVVFETDNSQLAKLMVWVIPDSSLTRAARYAVAKSGDKKKFLIDWWVRLDNDAGLTTRIDPLIHRLTQIAQHVRSKDVPHPDGISPSGTIHLRHTCWCGTGFSSIDPISEYTCTCGIKWRNNSDYGSWSEVR